MNDFYFAGDGREWPLGNIQMRGKSNVEAMKGEEPNHIGAVNPALTAMANAIRVGEHLLSRMS
jgi:hypothetical protein